MATQIQERRENPVAVVRQTLDRMGDQFKAALPAHISVDKFQRVALTAIQNNQDLLNADRTSLFSSLTKAAQDGLLPDGREGAIVLFGGKAQWMPMVAGIQKKIYQSGAVSSIHAHVVYANDHFVWHLGDDEHLEHQPPKLGEDRGDAIGAYAVATLKDGFKVREVMDKAEIEKVRAVSRAKGNGPWVAWWGEMARKTVIRRLSKRLPMSSDIDAAFERDDTMDAMHAETSARVLMAAQAPVSRLDALEHQITGHSDAPDLTSPTGFIAAMCEAMEGGTDPENFYGTNIALVETFAQAEADHVLKEAKRLAEVFRKAAGQPVDMFDGDPE